ncbi:YcnI family protein [Asanoa sp. NPDC050611]|uniref:YcnI family copper-binding membrane protein n=1 Tax=Asanoa sp. NPDC050611 TaxID=3157098 RepID=UPI0033E21FEB
MIRNRLAKAAALSAGAVVVALGIAGPAFAHVTVNPNAATQGGYARVAFRVPNESDTASTVKLEVNLPEDAPVASVSTMPVAGWTVAVEKRKLATPLEVHGSQVSEVVGKLTFTAAAGGGVKPGEFQEFPVSMGPLPEKDQMIFKVLQTYSDGEISRWIDEPVEGGEEPESPAPVLKLTKAADAAAPTTGPTVSAQAAGAGAGDADSGSSSGAAVGLGIAGLIAGVLGLVLGGMAFIRTRKTA